MDLLQYTDKIHRTIIFNMGRTVKATQSQMLRLTRREVLQLTLTFQFLCPFKMN